MNKVLWLDPDDESTPFPDVSEALRDPDGLLAVGGKLGHTRLLAAYRNGIFPWYSKGQPVLWWSPDPRTVLVPDEVRIRRSLRKVLERGLFSFTMDREFSTVMASCAEPRDDQAGTWITQDMQIAYQEFHRNGHAHSVEVLREGELVGGLYGVAVGAMFFGESMFSRVSDASKAGLVALCAQLRAWGFRLIDCQVRSEHLLRMGAREVPRSAFLALLYDCRERTGRGGPWVLDESVVTRFVERAKSSGA